MSAVDLTWGAVLLGLGFLLLSLGSVALSGWLLVRLPPTYFCDSHRRDWWIDRHPALRWTALVLKNLLGALIVALGIVMAMPGVPGPGLLVILIGITLLDFPGKRGLERRMIGHPRILQIVNDMRRRRGRPPLILEQSD